MGGTDLGQLGVGEQVVLPLGEPAPGLDLDAAGAHELLVGVALEEGVDLDLVDRWCDRVVLDEIDEPVGMEVRHAYRPRQASVWSFSIARQEL